ncbi:MAG: alpha/beta hydrolase [Bifidobacteriaceae bacterium]|jgi:acetyl esterase|nr:alpha/beta hydrolase [Bifidobacteriaceae bacterium]
MPIDPVAKEARRIARRVAGRPERTPAGWREQAARVNQALAARFMAPAPEEVTTRDVRVPVEGAPPVRVRLYIPPTPATPHPQTMPTTPHTRRGALLTFFGGAFRQGGLDFPTVDIANRSRAHAAGIVVAAVDYALAPEHAYPVALRQGLAALEWLWRSASSVGIAPERLAIGGASSGANLAAAVALANRDSARAPLRLQLLEVPALDLTGGHLDRAIAWRMGAPPFLVARGLRQIARDYLGDPALAREPLASPLLAPDLAGLPPARIFAAQYDLLRGDAKAYAARLAAAGVDAQLKRFAGQTHESGAFTKASPTAQRWEAGVVAELRALTA